MRYAAFFIALLCRQVKERFPLVTRSRHEREVAGLRALIQELRDGYWRGSRL